MNRIIVASISAIAISGCTPTAIANFSACADVVKSTLDAQPPGVSNTAKGYAAAQAAAASSACVGVTVDVINGVATLKPKSS